MLSHWPIRVKFLIGLGLLILLVVLLAGSGLYATYAYRSLVKDLSSYAWELPAASELSRRVGNLQMVVSEPQGLRASTFPGSPGGEIPLRVRIARGQFASDLDSIDKALDEYRGYLERKLNAGSPMADDQHESKTVGRIEPALERLRRKTCDSDWVFNDLELDQLREELENLQTLTAATSQPPVRENERFCRGGAEPIPHADRRHVDGQRLGRVGLHALDQTVLPVDLPAASDPHRRVAASGRRAIPPPHSSGHARRNGRTGRGDE